MTAENDDPEFVITTRTFKMPDTGFGQEAGFKDDAELIAHVEAERAKMDPAVREALEDLDRYIEGKMLGL